MIGASGQVGTPTIQYLAKNGARVRALTSNPTSAERLQRNGVTETFIGDFRRDEDVRRAVEGAASVFHVCPRFTEDELNIGKRVIAACQALGVGHIVFVSVFHPQLQRLDHHWHKLLVEAAVIESGIPFNIIQPSIFMQNILGGWQASWTRLRDEGVFTAPFSPDRKIRLIDTDNLGEVIAKVLMNPRLRGATFELGGPDSLTLREMAAIIGEELGRPVRIVALNESSREALAQELGQSSYAVQGWLKMWRHYDEHGFPGGNAGVLESVLGRSSTGYREFINHLVAQERASGRKKDSGL